MALRSLPQSEVDGAPPKSSGRWLAGQRLAGNWDHQEPRSPGSWDLTANPFASIDPQGELSDEAQAAAALRFPGGGPSQLTNSFGDPRGTRRHEGVDIMAEKLVPVFAVARGSVDWLRREQGRGGMVVGLRHPGGWRSRYMHLNNDSPGTDDGQGDGIADGIEIGATVEAGDLLGWVGDSGNAEHTAPHLHFELRGPDGAVDPYPALSALLASVESAG